MDNYKSAYTSLVPTATECVHPYENFALRQNQRAICSPTGQAPKKRFTKAGHVTLFLGVKREISPSCLPTCQQELTLKGVKSNSSGAQYVTLQINEVSENMPSWLSKIVLAQDLCIIAEAGKREKT
jgi:hypothetical protein